MRRFLAASRSLTHAVTALATPTTYSATYSATTFPVLHYDMESLTADGRMQDLSGNEHHGTITGSTDVGGMVGRARHFNTGDRITASAVSVPATSFTVATWFNWMSNPSP